MYTLNFEIVYIYIYLMYFSLLFNDLKRKYYFYFINEKNKIRRININNILCYKRYNNVTL